MEVGEPLLSDSNGNNVLVEHENVPFETAEIAENNHLVSSATPHEERSDDGKPLCIFVYGVRCHFRNLFISYFCSWDFQDAMLLVCLKSFSVILIRPHS